MTDPERLSPVERRLFGIDRSPPPQHLAALGPAMVDRTRITFELFRRDFEAAGSAATAAFMAGEITRQDGADLFVDLGHALSLPLTERYLAQGECTKLADWLRARPGFRSLEWLGVRNRMAIDGLVARGEGALAVALLRQHLAKAFADAKATWRYAARAQKLRDQGQALPAAAQDALRTLPAALDLFLLEIAECEPWIARYGARSDSAALDEYRVEIAKVRQRLNP